MRPDFEAGLSTPELSMLLSDWGRKGVPGVISEERSTPIGAAWCRFWDASNHSYGYVSRQVPEVAMAVPEPCRGRGVGRGLRSLLMQEASRLGLDRMSLSVERDNLAVALYESMGFKIIGSRGNAFTLMADSGLKHLGTDGFGNG